MAKTVAELQEKKTRLSEALARVEVQIKQQEFVDRISVGAYVDIQLGDNESYTNVEVLAVNEGEGTAGTWYKVLVNPGTADVAVKSVRLSNITQVYDQDAEIIW